MTETGLDRLEGRPGLLAGFLSADGGDRARMRAASSGLCWLLPAWATGRKRMPDSARMGSGLEAYGSP